VGHIHICPATRHGHKRAYPSSIMASRSLRSWLASGGEWSLM
jgi:hypothetical protein